MEDPNGFERAKNLLLEAVEAVISIGRANPTIATTTTITAQSVHPRTVIPSHASSLHTAVIPSQASSIRTATVIPSQASSLRTAVIPSQASSIRTAVIPSQASSIRTAVIPSYPSSSRTCTSSSPCSPHNRTLYNASMSEHKRLFGFKKGGRKKGKGVWRKECVCLSNCKQDSKPTAEEKMELARMGLGYSEIIFNVYGDAQHIHEVLLQAFPPLDYGGGYTLLRLSDNSYSLIEILEPDSGLTVNYLKDILNQAKLYIRPLQKNISYSDAKQYLLDETVSNEPSEMCNTCNLLFPLSSLRRHIMICKTQVRYIKFLLFFCYVMLLVLMISLFSHKPKCHV